jgi:hypothetical protein
VDDAGARDACIVNKDCQAWVSGTGYVNFISSTVRKSAYQADLWI